MVFAKFKSITWSVNLFSSNDFQPVRICSQYSNYGEDEVFQHFNDFAL